MRGREGCSSATGNNNACAAVLGPNDTSSENAPVVGGNGNEFVDRDECHVAETKAGFAQVREDRPLYLLSMKNQHREVGLLAWHQSSLNPVFQSLKTWLLVSRYGGSPVVEHLVPSTCQAILSVAGEQESGGADRPFQLSRSPARHSKEQWSAIL